MTRPADRLTGRDAGEPQPFSTRPYGMSVEEAAQVAGSSAGTSNSVSGTTGGAGERAGLTTGSFVASLRSGGSGNPIQ